MHHNDSPPEHDLISSLQRHGATTWKIRTNELARSEIRRERRAAIASGQLRGRRLSYDLDLNNDFLHGNYIVVPPIQSSDSGEDLGREKEEQLPVCLNCLSYASASASASTSSSFSSSSLLGKKVKEQNVTPALGHKTENGNWCKIGKWEAALASLAIASVVMLIFSVRCLGWGAYDQEQLPFLLVPT